MRRAKYVVAALVVALAIPITLVLRLSKAENDWARSFGPLDQWATRSKTAGNESGRALPTWVDRLVANSMTERKAVSDYVSSQHQSAMGAASPNPELMTYKREDVNAFATWLLQNPAPVIAHQFETLDEPIPNELGFLHLNRVLVGVAMSRAAAHDTAGARRLVDAAWRLNESFRTSPVVIDQLIGQVNFREQLAALRKFDVDAAVWLPRIRSVDFLQTLALSMQAETWRADLSVRRNVYAREKFLQSEREILAALGEKPAFKPRWLQLLRTPVRWFDLPSLIEGRREMLSAMRTVPRSENINDDLEAAYRRGVRRWWYIPDPDVTTQAPGTAFERAVSTLAERELTEKVLLARAARRSHGGKWPTTIDTSSAIADGKWVYTVAGSHATIQFSRPITWRGMASPSAPLRCDL